MGAGAKPLSDEELETVRDGGLMGVDRWLATIDGERAKVKILFARVKELEAELKRRVDRAEGWRLAEARVKEVEDLVDARCKEMEAQIVEHKRERGLESILTYLSDCGAAGIAEAGCLWCLTRERDYNPLKEAHLTDCPIERGLASLRE